jgi:hypothetical protein
VTDSRSPRAAAEVVCPHCKKPFAPELLEGSKADFRGSKCPHCRLFVPSNRANELLVED